MTTKVKTADQMPEVHPLAELFPLHEGEPLWQLAEDIKKVGQQQPIILLDGKILDGRRRWLACFRAKVKPWTMEFSEWLKISEINKPWTMEFSEWLKISEINVTPEEFVWSNNFHRRNLDVAERATAAAKFMEWQKANVKGPKKSRAEVAAESKVSEKTVQQAQVIEKKAVPELKEAVKSGKISIAEAAKIASKLPPEAQKEATKESKNERKARVTVETVQGAVVPPKTTGEVKFAESQIDVPFGSLLRAITTRNVAIGSPKDGPKAKQYAKIKDAMSNLLSLIEDWRKCK